MNEGERIREWLIVKRITNKELAEKLGLSSAAVSSILNGRNRMSIPTFVKLLQSYPDLCANWILLGDHHQRGCPYMTDEKVLHISKKDEEIAVLKKHVELQQELIELIKGAKKG